MTYNKSEIMKAAWFYYRTRRMKSFSFALRMAWYDAKKLVSDVAKGLTPFSEINIGDTLTFEFGDHDNHVTRIVTYIKESKQNPGYYLFGCGENVEICVRMNETVKRIAVAARMQAAA